MGERIIIFYNDSIDSDNWAAARALIRATARSPNTRIVWIFEPRQVSFGLAMSAEQQRRCLELITKHFPSRGKPFKVLLGGLLSDRDVNDLEGLSEDDKAILRLAIKPPYGPIDDAILHRKLVAWDHVAALSEWLNAPVEILIDLDDIDELENPVNLNCHRQEELVARSEDELLRYQNIMNEPYPQRVDKIREWYGGCINTAEKAIGTRGNSVKPLVLDSLCETIKSAESVQFLGGASLGILQRFIQKGVADKVKCHLQVGTCDLALNLFPNQFNIALNPPAAQYTFDHFDEFANFVVVPSHSAQNVQYSIAGLKKEGGAIMGERCLGFNCGEEPLKIARHQVTIENDYPDKVCPMSDLTAFLYALKPGFGKARQKHVRVENEKGTLLFRPSSSGISMYDLEGKIVLGENEVVDLLESLG
ncbi:hypothetical protein FDECE_5569 [Fusarium decemcellulare]|nr:hypothetical protein FDECE_5569 [Fusarium decemcellulare]